MPWHEKSHSTAFDTTPIPGLLNLHGDVLARRYKQDWLKGKKYPLISFPSTLTRELSDSTTEGGIVHIFSALELLRNQSRDAAFDDAQAFGQEYGYLVGKRGNDTLVINHPRTGNGYHIRYNTQTNQIANIERFPDHAMELLDGVSRASLPELYSGEKLGLNAVAPVKFFAPGSAWTWYPTEFDGEDLFFGLVAGFEVELGYFSWTELEGVRGAFGLPLERDLYYTPTTIRDLQNLHRQS